MMRPLLYAIAAPCLGGFCILMFGGWIHSMVAVHAYLRAATGSADFAAIATALVGVCAPIGLIWGAVTDDSGEETGP